MGWLAKHREKPEFPFPFPLRTSQGNERNDMDEVEDEEEKPRAWRLGVWQNMPMPLACTVTVA